MPYKRGLTIDQFSSDFRQRYLAVSGGWLGRLVIATSKTLGIWDPLVLVVIGATSYAIIRTSSMLMASILGLYYDACIPYQYYHIEGVYEVHRGHLDDYWPIFLVGTLIEAGALVLLDHHAFTLLVCIKSVALCWIWMGRKENGVFLSSALRHGKLAKPSKIPVGGIDWIPPEPNSAPSASYSSAATPPKPSLPPKPKLSNLPDADAQIKAVYPDPWVRWGMLHELSRREDREAKRLLKSWVGESADKRRAEKYRRRAKEEAARLSAGGAPAQPAPRDSSAPTAPKPTTGTKQQAKHNLTLPPMPKLAKFPNADVELRAKYPDPWVRWGMLHTLSQKGTSETKRMLKQFIDDPATSRRADKYKGIAEAAVASGEGVGVPSNSPVKGMGMDLARVDEALSSLFPDRVVREGMLESYRACRTDEEAEKNLHRWLTETDQIARRTKEYRQRGEIGRRWKRDLRTDKLPVFVDPWYEEWDKKLRANYPDPMVRYGLFLQTRKQAPEKYEAYLQERVDRTDYEYKREKTAAYGAIADEALALYDDAGTETFTQTVNVNSGRYKDLDFWRNGAERGGQPLSAARREELDQLMQRKNVSRAERAKVLEILSRPRAKSQEDAVKMVLARANILGAPKKHRNGTTSGQEDVFKLTAEESFAPAKRYAPKLDPAVAGWMKRHIDEGTFDVKDRRRTIAILDSEAQTAEEMEEIGEILGSLGLQPARAPDINRADEGELLFKAEDLCELRLKLLKGYGDSYVVDVMEAHVMKQTSKEDANRVANSMIDGANLGGQARDSVVAQFQSAADTLKTQIANLRKYYPESVVQVMKVDILFQGNHRYNYFHAVGERRSESDIAPTYKEIIADCSKRGVNDAYFKHWRKADAEKEKQGVFRSAMKKIGLSRDIF